MSALLNPPVVQSVDDPDICEEHGCELRWYDDGSIDSGPGEPYPDCPECRDEMEHPMVGCYMCVPLEQRGDEHSDNWPLRRTERVTVVNEHFDATTCYHLECGHNII